MANAQPVKVLTIGGSDSGGAAGVQADLKTFTALGAYGMSALTVVTAQNSVEVAALERLSPQLVAAQIDAVLRDYGAAAVKTGFIGSAALVETIARALRPVRAQQAAPLVVDPVLVNHRGASMFGADVAQAYVTQLLPACTVVTPNRREAALLCGSTVENWPQVEGAARQLRDMGAANVLITGVPRDTPHGAQFGDAFCGGPEVQFLAGEYIETPNTHGSGDTLSAALAVFLAQGLSPAAAVAQACAFTATAIRGAVHWRMGAGHGPVKNM